MVLIYADSDLSLWFQYSLKLGYMDWIHKVHMVHMASCCTTFSGLFTEVFFSIFLLRNCWINISRFRKLLISKSDHLNLNKGSLTSSSSWSNFVISYGVTFLKMRICWNWKINYVLTCLEKCCNFFIAKIIDQIRSTSMKIYPIIYCYLI